ncbi:MAG TPA: class I SAM-dependent methyltransferase [Candidatus Limnocylindrales bacterium]|nr:class I SAM-dependent methyltransferase [Candidatus Limnocylindrales bacterium]
MALRASSDSSGVPPGGVALLDAGVRRRLEQFGRWTTDRPAPGAEGFRRAPVATWDAADLRFDPGAGWSGSAWPVEPWTVDIDGLTLELRPTASGGLGLYPEHAANVGWLGGQVAARTGSPAPPSVLNLFAHTGLATLALARAGAQVTHVDGSRATIGWARRNAELSDLADRPIRWIVDDVGAFVAREARRGRRYDGIVLDPPAFGRGRGREWRLDTDLLGLLRACRAIAADDAFILLTAHSESVDGEALGAMLAAAFETRPGLVDTTPLSLTAASGVTLSLGWAARIGA